MTAVEVLPTTPWAAGRLGRGRHATLLFGRMYEDPTIEIDAFRDSSTILAIASAGDTAIALAGAGHQVTALDINPAQIAYVEDRMHGGPVRVGQADRLLAVGRRLLGTAGWTRSRLEQLSAMTDCGAQTAEWRRLTSGPSGAALRTLLAPTALRLGYRRAFADAAIDLRRELPLRIERGLAAHANRDNPWGQLLFTGQRHEPDVAPAPSGEQLVLGVSDVASHLEQVQPGTYDGYALSNVLDGAPDSYRHRLLEGLRRAGRPGAVVVLRTLGTPASPADARAAVRDRALIWGGVTISTTEEQQ